MKKYVVVVDTVQVANGGAGFDQTPTPPIEGKLIETYNLPPNMEVQRVTFQVNIDTNRNLAAAVINTRPMQNARDGVVVTGLTDVGGSTLPQRFSFEDFGEGEFVNTFYIASAMTAITGFVDVQIIIEGYQR